ncbi:hypothetical protein E2C01_100498 [Portunus trituberculatus]|uniref:Uncharacterized protein n=1 Tax=Portunus trituberculatus TaxID=210409 RepID=A0A5B7KCD3_PORTR|nr:hypothetical protein [Portunus trituberculatus]
MFQILKRLAPREVKNLRWALSASNDGSALGDFKA